MTGPAGYDARNVRCPVHLEPVLYKPAERFDPMGDVACRHGDCTAIADYDRAISDLLATGRATLPDGTTLSFTGENPPT